ncbi:hypothetical protein Cgig2_011533 [Carnegiea gigantea]|uniref:PB1-like domain-containing protein n=1 Tax=Carnegiea gigantea TaxID=171969 RepID=A0A9Q1QCD6_9CARY|nr:hypothetical protein Cgig2_011533 [Carnegiea gigantea]
MGDDSIILHLHHGGKFAKERKLNYEGGSCRIIEPVNVNRLSFFELKGITCEKISYAGLLDFFYVIPGCSMESGLRRLFIEEESVEMVKYCMGKKQIHVYTVHGVDPRLESPLPWNNLVGGDAGSSDDDSDYHPYGEDDHDSDNNWVVNEVATDDIDDNGAGEEAATCDGDDTEIKDVETSDDEWQMTKEQVGEFRKQNSKISETKSTAVENENIIDEAVGGGTELQSEYEDSEVEMETPGESDEEDNMFLRRKESTQSR